MAGMLGDAADGDALAPPTCILSHLSFEKVIFI
jgi:hypothetical protein